jgi:WD40 repeat protein
MLKGHQATILDLDWYPFDDHYLATSSMDNSIKIWSVPEEFHADITQENTTLYGHEKKVCLIQWNPTAAFVLASGGYDSTVRIWDV